MFVIDYLKFAKEHSIQVPPFHSGHLGLMPRSAKQTAALLHSGNYTDGCEICVTPYERPLSSLFRLKCVLKEQSGVVYRLLRAIAAMGLNILSWESAILESKKGHGVFMLLDWGTAKKDFRKRIPLPKYIENIFFPQLAGIIPANDLRYLCLLRQILGQCADVLLWEGEPHEGVAIPRLRVSEFEEERDIKASGAVEMMALEGRKVRLEDAGIRFNLNPKVYDAVRFETGREEEEGPLPYILLSDIESKTLRIFVPSRGREKRMIHLAFSHKNRPGALCAITEIIAKSNLSIVSGLVRKMSETRNILEVTIEHDSRSLNRQELIIDPRIWARENLAIADDETVRRLRYFGVCIESPMYPSDKNFPKTALYERGGRGPQALEIMSSWAAEVDVETMQEKIDESPEYKSRTWLTNLVLAPEWGPEGKPSIFLSYPKAASAQAEVVKSLLWERFEILVLQDGDTETITQGAIDRICGAHFFIGLWHHEGDGKRELSPWMPFEYGVARSHSKPAILLCHESLPERLVDRIDRDVSRIVYCSLIAEEPKRRELLRRCQEWSAHHRVLAI